MNTTALQPQLNHKEVEITEEHVQQFMSFINEGVVAWTKAGKMLVQMVERNPNTFNLIIKDNPQLSIEVLLAFEKIGRNEIYPYLLLEDSPGASRLLSLPYDLQAQYYKNGVDVITGWRNGSPIVAHKQISGLTKQETARAFSPSGARTIEEQKKLFPSQDQTRERTVSGRSAMNSGASKSLGQFYFQQNKAGQIEVVRVTDGAASFAIPIEIGTSGKSRPFEIFVVK